MVRWLFRPARGKIDKGIRGQCRQRLCGNNMVYTPSQTSFDRLAHAVIEEGVLVRFISMVFAKDIDETPRKEMIETVPHLRCEIDVTEEPLGIVHIDIFPRHVQITAADNLFRIEVMDIENLAQAIEPIAFVTKLFVLPVASLWHIAVHDRDIVEDGPHEPVFVGGTAVIETEGDVRGFRQRGNGDTVVPFESAVSHVVADIGKARCGEGRVIHLRLLHAEDGGTVLLKPGNDDMEAGTDGIHVIR